MGSCIVEALYRPAATADEKPPRGGERPQKTGNAANNGALKAHSKGIIKDLLGYCHGLFEVF